jgi:hypothetical protein
MVNPTGFWQEPRHAPRGRPRDPRGDPRGDPRDLRDPRQTAFEALRSLGLENPPSLLVLLAILGAPGFHDGDLMHFNATEWRFS